MDIMPPITAITENLAGILGRHKHNLAWLNTDTGDPYTPNNIARAELTRCHTQIPWRFQDAALTHPEHDIAIDWAADIVTAARNTPTTAAAPCVHRGPSLLILGPTGTGKTYTVYAAMREIAVSGIRNAWVATTAADLYADLRPRAGTDSEQRFRRAADAPLLILDDIGAAKDSEWTEEINYRLINHRYEHGLPMIITSNVPSAELRSKLGDRTASRLTGMCTPMIIDGTDRRRKNP